MRDFVTRHPETARALEIVKASPFSSGFANASYNALNAFRFVNAAGRPLYTIVVADYKSCT